MQSTGCEQQRLEQVRCKQDLSGSCPDVVTCRMCGHLNSTSKITFQMYTATHIMRHFNVQVIPAMLTTSFANQRQIVKAHRCEC